MHRVRLAAFAPAALALAACSAEAPPPYEQQPGGAGAAVQAQAVILTGEGLVIGGETLPFSVEREIVENALQGVIGEVADRSDNGECGAGPMSFSQFGEGFTVNFQQDRFVGWYLQDPDADIATADGVSVGTRRTIVEGETGFAPISDSTLGKEFALGGSIGGFLDTDEVSGLYAGRNCFFR
ncbi:aspartate-semialdehyde dehydrogenase [Erythrobacteraceae bacterium WH01K]|nr:aspartate-semialdehyde dehydrogenase [Erythrobacteraceae bacterium WH01K]